MGFLDRLTSLLTGRLDVHSRFTLERKAISGTMSKFYMARDRQSGEIVGLKILDPEKTAIRENGEWLSKLTFSDVIGLASNFTVQQFLARDNFSKRHQGGDPIWLHEFLYALMQGYDAVAMETDVQVGGTEQLFNLLAGRKLQEAFGQRPQVCITLPILVGTDGALRMSKSTGNYIGLDEAPEDKYGKAMSIPDSAIRNWFELVTRWAPEQGATTSASRSSR